LIGVIQDHAANAKRLLLLGHNPGLADFLASTVGYVEKFSTAALASLTTPLADWSSLDLNTPWHLQNLWRPRDLD
jgi:phosphohistidine phosphatase SixA